MLKVQGNALASERKENTSESYFITNSSEWKHVYDRNVPGNFKFSFIPQFAIPNSVFAGINSLITTPGFFNVLPGECVHVGISKNENHYEYISVVLIPPGFYANVYEFVHALNVALNILVLTKQVPAVPLFVVGEFLKKLRVSMVPVTFDAKIFNPFKKLYEMCTFQVCVSMTNSNLLNKLGFTYRQGHSMYQYGIGMFYGEKEPNFPSYPYKQLKMYIKPLRVTFEFSPSKSIILLDYDQVKLKRVGHYDQYKTQNFYSRPSDTMNVYFVNEKKQIVPKIQGDLHLSIMFESSEN